jgi:ribonuclease HII
MIVGIDEVGRGCWAGPLVAGAVALSEPIQGLKDSKVLTKLQRKKLAEDIYEHATATGLGWVSAAEVDSIGLTEAVRLAMRRAVAEISADYDEIIIDGNYNFLADIPKTSTLVHADATVPAVSAASIIAKVARDNWMCDQANKDHPVYGFDRHVGYGTKLHAEMLRLHGACELHRQSFKPIQQLSM